MSGERPDNDKRPQRKRRGKKQRKKKGPPKPPAAAETLRAKPVVDDAKTAEEPLSPEEVRELRGHFRFLSRHRKLLRLKPNAAEDRLLNGSQEPDHRGVCMHLLGKIDRATVQSTLTRIEVAGERTKFLDGVVRFSNDAAIVLLYLESLTESSSHDEAASALSAGFSRLDFDQVSSAQMRRILDLVVKLFPARERPQLLLGLLRSRSFRSAFDSADMPQDLAELLVPIRAVHAAAFARERSEFASADLSRGVELLLQADDATLRAHPEEARRRLFELGLELEGVERALGVILNSFQATSRTYSTLATTYASRLLRMHADDRARELLEKMVKHHAGYRLPAKWLDALGAPRVGRVALAEECDGWQRGFWLDRQRPVLVRVGREEVANEARLHRDLLVPSVAPLLMDGADGDQRFVAVEAIGAPGKWWRGLRDTDDRRVLALAREGVVLLAALLRAGLVLPDCEPARFLVDEGGRLWLFDLHGVREGNEDPMPLARAWCDKLLARRSELLALVETADNAGALAAALAAL